jgi:hypothetical protein
MKHIPIVEEQMEAFVTSLIPAATNIRFLFDRLGPAVPSPKI